MRQPIFKNLLIFSYERTPSQAVGFYLIYLLVIAFLSNIAGGSFALTYGETMEQKELIAKLSAHSFSVFMCFTLHIVVIAQKGYREHTGYILLALATFILALAAGPVGGLIPVSYLTTREKSK
jgi:hypothetical protein